MPQSSCGSAHREGAGTAVAVSEQRASVHEDDCAPSSSVADESLQRFAQLVIKDKESGREYMIADAFGGASEGDSTCQVLVDLATNSRRTFLYNTLSDARPVQLPQSSATSAPEVMGSAGALSSQTGQRSGRRGRLTSSTNWCCAPAHCSSLLTVPVELHSRCIMRCKHLVVY